MIIWPNLYLIRISGGILKIFALQKLIQVEKIWNLCKKTFDSTSEIV